MDHYKSIAAEVKTELVGLTAADGVRISGFKYHFIDRTIGSYTQNREGVLVSSSKLALIQPAGTREQARADGKVSRIYLGNNCAVVVNPDSGVLIQCNPLSKP